jgi:Domain of unknown function (DUF5916)/Carbohydrate family 9 binding domain-like
MLRHTALLILALVCLTRVVGARQEPAAGHAAVAAVHAIRTSTPINIDGRLDDEVWLRAPAATEFTQRDPDEGKPATERTEMHVVYDDAALYVGVRLYDREPARIARQLARRDREAEADGFWLFLDPHHDHLTGASFSVSAAGVQGDTAVYNDSWQDDSWDAVWASAVSIDESGWSLEMRIPYSQLRFPAADHHTFGINAMRYIQRKKEQDWLVRVPKTENGLASRFGHLDGLEGISPHRTVELLPYVVARSEYVEPSLSSDPFNDGARQFAGTGVDLKYRVSSNLSLDGTINPDFGQVEVDPAVVNLTAFETFFEEKRPFFIEGANIFNNFGRTGANNFWGFNRAEPQIFYSRRIGRAPQGSADGDFVDVPTATTILGAAKLTGKTRKGWSLGMLDAVTGREDAKTVTNGQRTETEVEPLSNYVVARAQREIGRRAGLGMLATAVNRDLRAPALRDLLPAQAYVGGVDGHFFLDSKRDWVISGRIAGSHLAGSTGAMSGLQQSSQRYYNRPDAPHVEFDPTATTLDGWTGSVNLNRQNGVHYTNVALWSVSPGFDSSDAGFNFASDRAGMHAVYQWRQPKPNSFSRERFIAIAKFYTWNFAEEKQSDGIFSFGRIEFKNYWSAFTSLYYFFQSQDDRATRGGPSMLSPSARGGSIEIDSDRRKRISGGTRFSINRDEFGGSNFGTGVNVRYRPVSSLDISTGPGFSRNHQLAQYVDTFADPAASATYGSRYVFATLHQREFNLETRINYVLSPKMSLQIYMQPLVSVGDYDGFKELARPRSFEFTEYGRDSGTLEYDRARRRYTVTPGDGGAPFSFDDPDFNFKSLRLNAIFRWEWRPGSAMYFVWTEQREDKSHPGEFLLRRDFSRTFRAPSDDVLMFKIAYWFQR